MASKSSCVGVARVRLEFQVTIIPKLHQRIIPRRKPTQDRNPGGKHRIKYDILEAMSMVSSIIWLGRNLDICTYVQLYKGVMGNENIGFNSC